MDLFLKIALVTIFTLNPVYPQQRVRIFDNFRDFSWGSSPEQVKKDESGILLQTVTGFGEYVLTYSDEFAGKNVRVDYVFVKDSLSSGIYSYNNTDDFKEDFIIFLRHLQKIEGPPNFRTEPELEQDNPWIKDGEYGLFKGPGFYWQFDSGFIALCSSKYKDKITISILYAGNKTIDEYNKTHMVSIDDFR